MKIKKGDLVKVIAGKDKASTLLKNIKNHKVKQCKAA